MAQSQDFTIEQQAALDQLVRVFDVDYSKCFEIRLVVHDREWTEAEVNTRLRVQRKAVDRRRIKG